MTLQPTGNAKLYSYSLSVGLPIERVDGESSRYDTWALDNHTDSHFVKSGDIDEVVLVVAPEKMPRVGINSHANRREYPIR